MKAQICNQNNEHTMHIANGTTMVFFVLICREKKQKDGVATYDLTYFMAFMLNLS